MKTIKGNVPFCRAQYHLKTALQHVYPTPYFYLFSTEVSTQSIKVITWLPLKHKSNLFKFRKGEVWAPPPYFPVLLIFLNSTPRIWSMMELEGFPENWSQALGVYWHPLMLGSSGTLERTLSSSVLKSFTEHCDMFLTWIGNELNSLGPCIWKEFSRKVLTLLLPPFNVGTVQILPSLGFDSATTPQFGTRPSRTFHV